VVERVGLKQRRLSAWNWAIENRGGFKRSEGQIDSIKPKWVCAFDPGRRARAAISDHQQRVQGVWHGGKTTKLALEHNRSSPIWRFLP
jgi:hypothetical protein